MPVTSPNPEARCSDTYQSKVVSRIEECLTHGPQTLQTILRGCQGAYPTVVLDCVRRLSDRAEWVNLTGVALTDQTNRDREVSILDSLEGNPVLCSWYFTRGACERIGRLRDWS